MSKQFISQLTESLLKTKLLDYHLPDDFISTVKNTYWPLSLYIHKNLNPRRTNIIGIQGSHGSGKSTCADFLKSEFDLKVLVASIDDFYLTRSERKSLGQNHHPLLQTRGVPGTHDIGLIQQCFENAQKSAQFRVPSFSKAIDDRLPESNWPNYTGPFDVVILEGWCVGLPAQSADALKNPINGLERLEDKDRTWRKFVNSALHENYQSIFKQIDTLVSLQAPNFDCVYRWRLLQEKKLIATLEAAGRIPPPRWISGL